MIRLLRLLLVAGVAVAGSSLAAARLVPSPGVNVVASGSGAVVHRATAWQAGTTSGLASPVGLTAVSLSDGVVSLNWVAVNGAVGYTVERARRGSAAWKTLVRTVRTSYTDTGLTGATSYAYRVSAVAATITSIPSAAVVVTTLAGPHPYSVWTPSAIPTVPAANDESANELGVKFEADVGGSVTGLRFYKGFGNTGTHVGHLWNDRGTLLGSATFTDETDTGWQQVDFPEPIPIAAGAVYIASYFAPSGHYAADQGYFATAGVDDGPIHLLPNGADGADGVYRWQRSGFPIYTYRASNYWVDVIFRAGPPDAPFPVAATAEPGGRIALGWAASPGATGYSIAYSADGVHGWTVVGSTSQTSWIDVRPVLAVANYFAVSAVSPGGSSGRSIVVSAVPTN